MWELAWPAADVEAIAALYAEGAVFHSHPFRDREVPGEYVARVFAEQEAARCRFGEAIVDGDRATVDWWAEVTAKDGSVESLAGISLLRFDPGGLVVEQRDAWGREVSRSDPPDWARGH